MNALAACSACHHSSQGKSKKSQTIHSWQRKSLLIVYNKMDKSDENRTKHIHVHHSINTQKQITTRTVYMYVHTAVCETHTNE